MKYLHSLFLLCLTLALSFFAEENNHAPKIYIDCNYCDLDYVRSEIKFVNYVIDRKVADVFIMITSETTGSNGQNYTVEFNGQSKFINKNDTLQFATQQDDTDDIVRQKLVKCLKLGLISYISHTSLSEDIIINYNPKTAKEITPDDPWDSWVISLTTHGNMNSQKSYDSYWAFGSVNIKRVTDEWKINTSIYGDYSEENYYSYDENDNMISSGTDSYFLRGQNFYALVVKSIDEHWSAGASGSVSSSTYSNYQYRTSAYPAIEYNIFPYSESNSKELKCLYKAGWTFAKYNETTIYNYNAEGRFNQSLEISMEIKKPWGSIETNLTGSNYFFDIEKNRLDIFSAISLNVVKGLSVSLYGRYSIIHDQLNLPRGERDPEELLLKKNELATQYTFWSSVGISYTFGSIYNNVVNSRF
ncbi:MAG: hypothetical protein GQ534_06665 [Candidatus Delongbacteria bacterium]|nr:hypothetical protein [Candidatus Delongbacteria bacterium]